MLRLAVCDKILQVFTELFSDLHVIDCDQTIYKKFLSLFIVQKF